MLLRITIIILLSSLVSCSVIQKQSFIANRDKGYLRAQSIPPIMIPAGLENENFSNKYPIANKDYPEEVKDVSLVPPGL